MALSLRRAVALALIGSTALAAESQDDPLAGQATLTPELLVRAALARNAEVAAAQGMAAAAGARPGMAAAWMDPMLEWSFAPISIADPAMGFGTTVGLSQRFIFPGKTRLRADAARAEARAADRSVDQVRLALAEAAVRLYADWYLVARARAVNRDHRGLLAELRRAAEAQYTAGMAPQQDVLRADLTLAELAQEELELSSQAKVVALRINALLHRPLDAPLPDAPAELVVPDAAAAPQVDGALATHPALSAVDARATAASARVELARKAWAPDFAVMASYSTMWASPAHRLMLGLSVDLPLWQEQRRQEVAEARAMARALSEERRHLRVELEMAVAEAAVMVSEAAALLRGQRARVLPAAKAALDSARSSYVTGKVEFSALIEGERELRNAVLREYQLGAELLRRRALLEKALGAVPGIGKETP